MPGSTPSETDGVGLKRPFSVLLAVVTDDRTTLILHRQAPARFWQSVTGSLEPGESPREAALRELREETGLVVPPDQLHDHQMCNRYPIPEKWASRYAPHDRHNTEHVFSLRLPAPIAIRIDPDEHSEAQWCPLAEAIERVWSWTNKDLLSLLDRQTGA